MKVGGFPPYSDRLGRGWIEEEEEEEEEEVGRRVASVRIITFSY